MYGFNEIVVSRKHAKVVGRCWYAVGCDFNSPKER